jgi:hypothetical protein
LTETITPAEYRALATKKRRKYGNQPLVVDGTKFDSKKEAKRYVVLRQRERLGEIEDLELQPRYPIEVAGVHICSYIADFSYLDRQTGERVTEDVKGVRTAAYRLKKKLLRAVYGVEIVEI